MELSIIQQIIIGAIQGVTEWIPISSSGMITLIMTNFLGILDMPFLLHYILLLHLGTTLAAMIYFRKEIIKILQSIIYYKRSHPSTQKVLKFLLITTIVSGIVGVGIFFLIEHFSDYLEITGKFITGFVAVLLLFTGLIQLNANNKGIKKEENLNLNDGLLLGFVQGISSLPGISRSGITVSSLLLRKFNDTTSIRLSFLMSIPIVLIGNIFLNYHDLVYVASSTSIYGITSAFVFGIITIHLFMKLSKKINFGWFVLIFAALMILSLWI